MVAHNPVLYQSSDRRDLTEQGRLCVTVSKAGFEALRELTVTGSEIFFSVKNQNGGNRGRKGLLFGASEKVK